MPALTMRGRYLMREYWSDSDLFMRLNAAEREVYVGLWMLADDTGWLPRDVPAIAAALFRYEDRAPREAKIRSALDRLRVLRKVQSHRCGCLFLPAVSKYPRAGRKTDEHRTAHQEHSKRSKGIQRDLKPLRQTYSNPSPDVSPSLPDVAGVRALGGAPSAFDELMDVNGIDPAIAGRKH